MLFFHSLSFLIVLSLSRIYWRHGKRRSYLVSSAVMHAVIELCAGCKTRPVQQPEPAIFASARSGVEAVALTLCAKKNRKDQRQAATAT